jgi:FKBP-type peptidyl-prolyl cis-trans isomerase FkpA/FKBP-type peptidyl-prolyl cis-trans isomerase FklB
MKKISILALAAIFMAGSVSCDSKRKSVTLKTTADTVFYLIGSSYGHGLSSNQGFPGGGVVNREALAAGFFNASAGGDTVFLGFTNDQINQYVQEYFNRLANEEATIVKEESQKFLEENKGKPGIITTESGLQYQVVQEGTGPKATEIDTVVVHYTLSLPNGDKLESSLDNGQPATFAVNQVIPGWVEGIPLMPQGSKYKLFIPADLAYGDQGRPSMIKGGQALVFDVELLEVKKAVAPKN